jgi:acyl-CoA reductase-like NAD-dependent aldehyde dehydrogenase
VEQRARDKAVARANFRDAAIDTLIDTRARQVRNDPPLPDRLVAQEAIRAAQTRRAWSQWHLEQAARHRQTLTDLVVHHEEQAARLGGSM